MLGHRAYLDRITNRTAVVGGLFLALTALLTGSFSFFETLRSKFDVLKELPSWQVWAVAGVLLCIAAYLFKAAFGGKSRLLRPERFRINADEPRFLKGREHEVEELGRLAEQETLIFLDGESGSGKSAVVRAGLVPRYKSEKATLLPIFIDLSGADLDRGLFDHVGRILWREHEEFFKELGSSEYPRSENVFESLKVIKSRSGRLPLLIFDQFDDYQTTYRAKFYAGNGSRLIKSEEFLAGNLFWNRVALGANAGNFHCILITRSDSRSGVDAIRFTDAATYSLQRVDYRLIEPLLTEITTPENAAQPVVEEPEFGWLQLQNRLLSDLSGQDGRILPIQLTVALDALRRWPFLTVAQYRREGGLAGLARLHIEGHVQDAARDNRLEYAKLTRALLSLTDTEGKKTVRRSFEEIKQAYGNAPPEALESALGQLEKDRLLRRVTAVSGTAAESWLLYHDYLAAGVIEAFRASDRWRILLDQRSKSWRHADGLREKWSTLLSIRTQFRIAWEAAQGRLRLGPYREYLAWSIARFGTVLLGFAFLGAIVGGYNLLEANNIAKTSIRALDNDSDISPNEAEQLRSLIRASWRAKYWALAYALETADNSSRSVEHVQMLGHAIVGLDNEGRKSRDIIRVLLVKVKNHADRSILNFAARLLSEIWIINPNELIRTLLAELKSEKKDDVRIGLAAAVAAVAVKLESKAAEVIVKNLLEQLKNEKNDETRMSLAGAVGAVGAKLELKAAEDILKNLLEQLKNEKNVITRQSLAGMVGAVGAKLEAKAAEDTVTNLLEQLKNEKNDETRMSLAAAVGAVGAKLESKAAEDTIKNLLEQLENEKNDETRTSLAAAAGAVGAKLDTKAAEDTVANVLGQLKPEQQSTLIRSPLLTMLVTIEKRIDSKSRDITTRAQKYVNLLKDFDGGVFESRKAILEILETITGEKFNSDKWKFVEWATSRGAAKYSLDLD